MSRKLPSSPSIQACLEELEKKETEREKAGRDLYLAQLKAQCQIRENALKTAQSLISAYQNENNVLKQENGELKERIQQLQHLNSQFKTLASHSKSSQKSLLKYSQKINDLLEQNLQKQQRIHFLQRQVQTLKEQVTYLQLQNSKNINRTREQRQKVQLQSHFKSYNKQSHKPESIYSSLQKHAAKDDSDRKVLEWKLKQKDEQILILLKRLKCTQQQLSPKHNRLQTFDSVDNSTKQSRKLQFSEFQQ